MATIHEPLVCSVFNNDIEAALYETGHLLNNNETTKLECSWIHILSLLGEVIQLKNVPEFQRCIMHIHGILIEDEVLVRDAFLATSRLVLLSRKYPTLYAKPVLSKIRDKVLEMFPEGAVLNENGLDTFRKVLPPNDTHEYMFIQRILAGLTKIWGEKKHAESRLCLEYLTRKKFQSIPKPTWIVPHLRDDLDLVWVLWGAAILYFNNDVVMGCYDLFTFQCKKQTKVERQGLLWSICFHEVCSYKKEDAWGDDDLALYARVESKIESLWQQVVGNTTTDQQVVMASDDPFFWTSYFPRVQSNVVVPVYDFKEEVRILKIKGIKSKQ